MYRSASPAFADLRALPFVVLLAAPVQAAPVHVAEQASIDLQPPSQPAPVAPVAPAAWEAFAANLAAALKRDHDDLRPARCA